MFEQWLKFWLQWMFWWLPGGDEPQNRGATREPQQPTAAPKSDAEAANVDAAATWQPAYSDGNAGSALSDDLSAIKGIGPGIVHKLDALGIKTFADLAHVDPDDLASKLALRQVTPARVREWVAEAEKRLGR
jgi:predicted flap endonuclease-1-like 5' DNA nuclease